MAKPVRVAHRAQAAGLVMIIMRRLEDEGYLWKDGALGDWGRASSIWPPSSVFDALCALVAERLAETDPTPRGLTEAEVQTFPDGLYRVAWVGGGRSVAAVGTRDDGSRWLAPTNWVQPSQRGDPTPWWEGVAALVPIVEDQR